MKRLILIILLSQFVISSAHDPYAPEYYDTGSVNNGFVEEWSTQVTTGDYFILLGVVTSICLAIALPEIFDGEHVNNIYSSRINFTCLRREPCLKIPLYSFSF